MIAEAVMNPEEDKLIEVKLGIVTHHREVTNIAQTNNQKVDKEEFVTDLCIYLIQQKGVKDAKDLIKRLNDEKKERELRKKQQEKLDVERRLKESEEL